MGKTECLWQLITSEGINTTEQKAMTGLQTASHQQGKEG